MTFFLFTGIYELSCCVAIQAANVHRIPRDMALETIRIRLIAVD